MKKKKATQEDENQIAFRILKESTETPQPKDPIKEYLSEIGRKGGLKGGKVRADKLTSKRRKEIASKAAKTRWAKKKP